jgi:uncharacterized protein (DUF362 family)
MKDLPSRVVYCARSERPDYGAAQARAPELEPGVADDQATHTIRRLLAGAGLDHARFGTAQWNPLGNIVPRGAKILIKPNWVLHTNLNGEAGTDCLVTHTSVIRALLRYLVRADVSAITIGDAPLQGCDFAALRAIAGLDRLQSEFPGIRIVDFRRKVLLGRRIGSRVRENGRSAADEVLFDLGAASLLEPITRDDTEFRVTMYDPKAIGQTHSPGKHQYLIAKEVLDADVVFNLPKLKTHKKAGLTGALKNLVGINVLKDYLPHHRKGGAETGGDCYAGGSRVKRLAEDLLDASNVAPTGSLEQKLRYAAARTAIAAAALMTGDPNIEGSWSGNDTVWRMSLDIRRILHYGTTEGSLDDVQQRTVVHLTDAIVAGQGEGPLSPFPAPVGALTMASSSAAADWVHALLLGFAPSRIPLIRHAFDVETGRLAQFRPDQIEVVLDGVPLGERAFAGHTWFHAAPPSGWAGACERGAMELVQTQ